MKITVQREQRSIKNGYSATSPALRIAAHGYSPEVADRNLERTMRLLFTSMQRDGRLADGLAALGLEMSGDGDDIEVVLV